MDGLTDQSPWLATVLFIDHLDRLVHEQPFSTALGCGLLTCLCFFGDTFELVCCAVFATYQHGYVVRIAGTEWPIYSNSACLFALAAWYILYRASKPADTTQILRLVFRQYLQHLVHHSPAIIAVQYLPSGDDKALYDFHSPRKQSSDAQGDPSEECRSSVQQSAGKVDHLSVEILTPAFYARFVHYAHDSEAMFREMATEGTIRVDRPELLPKIFLRKAARPLQTSGILGYICFETIRRWRRGPGPLRRSVIRPTMHVEDIRGFRMSSMDAFVIQSTSRKTNVAYRGVVLRLFIADWLFGGNTAVLRVLELICRAIACWTCMSLVSLST